MMVDVLRTARRDLFVVFDHDLDDDVAELDVHDGGHGLLFGPQQSRPETHAQVRHRHQVLVRLGRNAGKRFFKK